MKYNKLSIPYFYRICDYPNNNIVAVFDLVRDAKHDLPGERTRYDYEGSPMYGTTRRLPATSACKPGTPNCFSTPTADGLTMQDTTATASGRCRAIPYTQKEAKERYAFLRCVATLLTN